MPAPKLGPIRIDVHALVHATEDEEKVSIAIQNLFPIHIREALQFSRKRMRGHFHNPIVRLVVTLSNREFILQTLQDLGSRLPTEDRKQLQQDLELHFDGKGQLFCRFDKQESYHGHLKLVDRGDSLRLVIKFPGRMRDLETVSQFCQQCKLL
ncbi:MAG: RNA-binding domain-containing protein [Promethearchaeota archaeon]